MTPLLEITVGFGITALLTTTAWWWERKSRKTAERRLRESEELRLPRSEETTRGLEDARRRAGGLDRDVGGGAVRSEEERRAEIANARTHLQVNCPCGVCRRRRDIACELAFGVVSGDGAGGVLPLMLRELDAVQEATAKPLEAKLEKVKVQWREAHAEVEKLRAECNEVEAEARREREELKAEMQIEREERAEEHKAEVEKLRADRDGWKEAAREMRPIPPKGDSEVADQAIMETLFGKELWEEIRFAPDRRPAAQLLCAMRHGRALGRAEAAVRIEAFAQEVRAGRGMT